MHIVSKTFLKNNDLITVLVSRGDYYLEKFKIFTFPIFFISDDFTEVFAKIKTDFLKENPNNEIYFKTNYPKYVYYFSKDFPDDTLTYLKLRYSE